MRMDDRADLYGRSDHRTPSSAWRAGRSTYLRSRSSEHWLMFGAGLAIGLLLG